MATETAAPVDLLARVQELTERVDELPDPRARELAQELVASVIAMYGDGLARIMDVIAGAREAGATILDELSQDGAVASLLLIHDLYPIPLEERVLEALDTVRPYMESHGGNVELVELRDGVARLALRGQLQWLRGLAGDAGDGDRAGARASTRPISRDSRSRGWSEEPPALGIALPMAGGELAELPMLPGAPDPGSVLPVVQSAPPPAWIAVDESARPAPGQVRAHAINGEAVLFADGRRLPAGLRQRVRGVR